MLVKSIIFVVLFYFVFVIRPSNACQCVTINPSDLPAEKLAVEEIEASGIEMFLGTVVDVRILNVPSGKDDTFYIVRVAHLTVDRLWFGKHQWLKAVYTEGLGPSCGIDFKIGEHYFIQSDEDDHLAALIAEIETDGILSNRCSSTLFDPKKDASVIDKLDKVWKPWVPNVRLASAPANNSLQRTRVARR